MDVAGDSGVHASWVYEEEEKTLSKGNVREGLPIED